MPGKRLTLLSAAALMVAGGGWMWLQDASAAANNFPGPNIEAVCDGDRDHDLAVNAGPLVHATTHGAIRALTGQTTSTTDGRLTMNLAVQDTFTQGTVEGVGDLVITLDRSRNQPASTLTSNKAGQAFPATQTMRFFPLFILNGETFSSTTPVQVVNSNVTSFPPAQGTTYVLTNAMTLRSSSGNTISLRPGRAFTIKASS